jgi:hypothetical protein
MKAIRTANGSVHSFKVIDSISTAVLKSGRSTNSKLPTCAIDNTICMVCVT